MKSANPAEGAGPERASSQASRRARALRVARARQAWTIARIELRRVFFARRSLWIYALALTSLVPGLKLFDIKCAWFPAEALHALCPAKPP